MVQQQQRPASQYPTKQVWGLFALSTAGHVTKRLDCYKHQTKHLSFVSGEAARLQHLLACMLLHVCMLQTVPGTAVHTCSSMSVSIRMDLVLKVMLSLTQTWVMGAPGRVFDLTYNHPLKSFPCIVTGGHPGPAQEGSCSAQLKCMKATRARC